MSIVLPGVIKNGGIDLKDRIELPEGTAVNVRIEESAPADLASPPAGRTPTFVFTPGAVNKTRTEIIPPKLHLSQEEWLALPFHGEWKDRADITDSVEYVNELRQE